MHILRPKSLVFVLLGLLTLNGCGSDGESLAPVTGTVTYNGQPLPHGTIAFFPEGGRPAYGKIADGRIVEMTFVTANDGVPVGTHQVTIQSIENADNMYAEQKSLLPQRYTDPHTSGLTAEINKGRNELTFELTD